MKNLIIYCCIYIDCVGLFLPLIIFWILGKKLSFPGKKNIAFYFFTYFVITSIATRIADLGYYNNYIYDVLPLVLSIILFSFFNRQFHTRHLSHVSFAILLMIVLVYILTWKNVVDIDLNAEYYLFFAIFILINATLYFFQEINRAHILSIYDTPQFWFIVSMTFYALASAIVWGSFEYVKSKPSVIGDLNIKYFWVVTHNPILFVSCLVFSTYLILRGKKFGI
jgi:hypothetical protein